ncbi:MAG: hypothetical protein KA998_02210 [Rickettsiaceae bacterium]|nr:hypothetical protein [Rickettsiaceae bacterium]
MTGAEIALVATVATAVVAAFGLQAWRCSEDKENISSDDSATIECEYMALKNGDKSFEVKGLKIKFSDTDKVFKDNKNTDAKIGDKDVSLAILGKKNGAPVQESKVEEMESVASALGNQPPTYNIPLQSPHKITSADLFQSFLGFVVHCVEYKQQGKIESSIHVPLIAESKGGEDHDV